MSYEDRGAPLPSVDVVICTYTEGRLEDLLDAIESVGRQQPAPAKVIVVVDHNDVLLHRLRQVSGIVAVPNRHARGLSGARNTGLDYVTAEVVAFLDDDACARPGWLEGLARVLVEPDVAGAGSAVQAAWERGRPKWFPIEFDWVVGCTHPGMPHEVASIRNPVGAAMAFRVTALRDVHGFDAGLGRIGTRPVGCEETELSINIRRQWGTDSIKMAPDSVVDHHVPDSRGRLRYFVRRCWSEGRSKAVVAARTSADESLESERLYVRRVLPAGVARGVVRPPTGWARAGAIIVGTAVTTTGFVVGRLSGSDSVTASPEGPQRAQAGV